MLGPNLILYVNTNLSFTLVMNNFEVLLSAYHFSIFSLQGCFFFLPQIFIEGGFLYRLGLNIIGTSKMVP